MTALGEASASDAPGDTGGEHGYRHHGCATARTDGTTARPASVTIADDGATTHTTSAR